jgi:hypothetical protein
MKNSILVLAILVALVSVGCSSKLATSPISEPTAITTPSILGSTAYLVSTTVNGESFTFNSTMDLSSDTSDNVYFTATGTAQITSIVLTDNTGYTTTYTQNIQLPTQPGSPSRTITAISLWRKSNTLYFNPHAIKSITFFTNNNNSIFVSNVYLQYN